MARTGSQLDKLVQPAVTAVASRTPYFTKQEILAEVLKHEKFAGLLADLRTRHGKWHVDALVIKYAETRIGEALSKRDPYGIRIYECYKVPDLRERRWMMLRAMTREQLLAVMREARTQERSLHIKGEGYRFFLDQLERATEGATVGDIYEKALPEIQRHRAAAGAA